MCSYCILKMSDPDCLKQQILEYMLEENRSYSANDIFNNIHIDSGKSAFTDALDRLVKEEKVKEKTYGRQKIYFVNHDLLFDFEVIDLESLDDKIAQMKNIYDKLQKEAKNFEIKVADLEKSLTTDEAEAQMVAVKSEILLLQDKVKTLQSQCGSLDPNEMKSLSEAKEKFLKEFQLRNRIAKSIIDAILENYPNDKSQLLEDIGVEETDDGFKLQNSLCNCL